MKLSELTYAVVKNVKYLEDTGFTYNAFLNKNYDDDQDYANSINNAMAPINEAIHRLSDRNKILYQIASLGVPNDSLVNTSTFAKHIKKIKSVFYMNGDQYLKIGYREFGKGFIFIQSVTKCPLYVEYIEDIPTFSKDDVYDKDKDIDLYNLGINETMCSYIIEYAQGKLQEPIAPELANMHITRAEQYMDDLDEQQTGFNQEVVANKYGISR